MFYVVGTGGLGRETYDAVLASSETIEAFLDEHRSSGMCRGLPIVGVAQAAEGDHFVIGIADPAVRRRLAEQLISQGLRPRTVVHPQAIIARDTTVGDGTVVLAHAYVSSGVRLGRHVHVNYNATIGHDTVIGDRVTVLPGANVGGSVHLADDVTIGANACILQGLHIGSGSIIGAGAVVTRDCEPGQVFVGVPARPRSR